MPDIGATAFTVVGEESDLRTKDRGRERLNACDAGQQHWTLTIARPLRWQQAPPAYRPLTSLTSSNYTSHRRLRSSSFRARRIWRLPSAACSLESALERNNLRISGRHLID